MEKTTRRRWSAPGLLAAVLSLVLAATGSVIAGSPALAASPGGLVAVALQANARTEPLGISTDPPTLSWKSESSSRGAVQSAYEVRVGTSEGGAEAWDTGKVHSDDQLDVVYAGTELQSQTRYYWQVRLWDGADHVGEWSESSWFETGLETEDWQADWIGKSTAGEVDRWTNYTVDIDFAIDKLAIGVFLRATSTRDAYMWQISTADGTGIPKFRPHKRVNNTYALLDSKAIPGITPAELLSGTHRLSFTLDGNTITTKLDGAEIDQRTDSSFSKGFIGFRQDYANNVDETAYVKAAKVTAKNGDVLLDTDFSGGNPFNGGTLTSDGLRVGDRTDVLLTTNDSNKPLLRTEFTTEAGKAIQAARAYASAHGVYELQLNGAPVGDQRLAPGSTDYRKRIQYQSYDVTDQVKSGANAFGAELGDGWWAGKVGMWGPGMFGSSVGLIAQLRIDYTDGTHQIVKTDSTWKSHSGPYKQADNIDGESYDANAEQPGWDQSDYDDSAWSGVTIAASDTNKLVPQPDEPVRVTQELPALTRADSPGVSNGYIYDVGQNMVGVATMRIQGKAGDTVRIRYAEELYKDGRFYVGNLRAAKVTDYYTFKADETVEYTPKFTQHGFRYIEISGAATPPAVEDVTGIVWGSDLTHTGDLETSDAMLNQLVSNISWGQRGNFLSIPTDTPARDERLGWTGDINVFAPTASYLSDTRAFLQKWMGDLSDSARSNGDLPGIAPSVPTIDLGTGLGWSDAGITVPYAVWQAQGDKAIIRQNYALMKKYLELVKSGAGEDLIDTARGNWNDWLNLDDNTGVAVLGTAYYAEDARMLAEMAAAIGNEEDAAAYGQLSEEVRAAFTATLIAEDGTVQGGSQTAYAMALGMNLVTDPELRVKVGEKYLAKLAVSDYHLTTGFLGTPWLLPALSSIGRDDIAYKVLLQEDYPSWGYEIANGATTMWERWNSIKPDGSFGDEGMNSFNHYAYGAVGDWMYRNIGGISPLEPGYKKFSVAPAVGGGLTHGAGEYASVYGKIVSSWKLEGEKFALDVTVPANTSAEVTIPAEHRLAITESGVPLADADGVSDIESRDGSVTFILGSGTYQFLSDPEIGAFGALLDALEALGAHVNELVSDGDLPAAEQNHILSVLSDVTNKVDAAVAAVQSDDRAASQSRLAEGVTVLRDLRSWLSDRAIDSPVKKSLEARLAQLEALFGRSVVGVLGLAVVLPPATSSARPGGAATGAVELANNGTNEITDIKAVVTVPGWSGDPVHLSLAKLLPGESAQLPVTITVPRHQAPGRYRATAEVSFTTSDGSFSLRDEVEWVVVESGLRIGDVAASADLDTGSANVTVHLVNEGDTDVAGQVKLTNLAGIIAEPASARVVVPAGDAREIEVAVLAGLEGVSGASTFGVSFVDQGAVLAQKSASINLELAAPGASDLPGQLDHVDFGAAASESAHALQAAAASGTAPNEAGLTRRYAHTNYPGSWYSALYTVEAGKPFLLRNLETFDGARTKKYNVWVDDVLVRQMQFSRSESGAGSKAYQILIDDPRVLDNNGTVRIKFEYPLDASGYWDPSIADSWVLPVPADAAAPLVSATIASSAAQGDNGWFRGNAQVTLDAVDDRDGNPVIQIGGASGWESYTAPVAVNGDGKHVLSYRAKDASGKSSGEQKAQVWIDGTAPVSTIRATRGSGVAGSDRATLQFSASDSLSGVSEMRYRIDNGDWEIATSESVQIEGYGVHVVDYYAIDNAGNPEQLRSTEVVLSDAENLAAIAPPEIGGIAVFGAQLRATTGSWNTKGLSFSYRWTRDGKAISGATGSTYRLVKADVGHRVGVAVSAVKSGYSPVTVSSRAIGAVKKAAASVSVRYSKTTVKKGGKTRITIQVSSATSTPAGKVVIYENGKRVKTLKLSAKGKVSYSLKLKTKGKRSIRVAYLGSSGVKAVKSKKQSIRVK